MNSETTHALRLERTYQAPLAMVRRALTDPEKIAQWFAPGDMVAKVHAYDARPGGQYEVTMSGEDGDHTCTGTFDEVGERRISMSFNWSNDPMPNDTTLTFTLEEHAGATRLVLEHTGFGAQEARDMHEEGWTGCLVHLARLFS